MLPRSFYFQRKNNTFKSSLVFFSSVTTTSPDLVVFFSGALLLFSLAVCLEVMSSKIECFHQALLVIKSELLSSLRSVVLCYV